MVTSCFWKQKTSSEMRVHSYLVRMPNHFNRKYFLHVSPTFLEAIKFRLKVFNNLKLQKPHLLSRHQNNIRSQASRTSHLKTSFWERGTQSCALRMSMTSLLFVFCLSEFTARENPFSGKSCFLVLSLYACYALVFAITPQGSNVDLRFVNKDVSLICGMFACSFRGIRTEELKRRH